MSTIGGPGGVGGPGRPNGAADSAGVAADDPAADALGRSERGAATGAAGASAAIQGGAGPAPVAGGGEATAVDALAAEIAAGRLTPTEAIDRLIEATAGPGLGPAERAELRELLADLIAADPHLAALAGRVGP
jgi:hypothetical protein